MRKMIAVLAVLLLALVMLPAQAQRPPCGHPPDPPCKADASVTAPAVTAPVMLAQADPVLQPARSTPLAALGLFGVGFAGYALVRRFRPEH